MKNSANSTHLFIIPVYPNIRDIRVDIKESVHQTRPCENTALCNDRYLLIIVLARTLRQTSFWPFWCSAIIMQVRVYIDEVLYYFTFIKFSNVSCIFLTPNLFFRFCIQIVVIYHIWETFRNKLKEHFVSWPSALNFKSFS